MTHINQKMASALMESILAAFRTETADLVRLADEVDAAGQDIRKIRAAVGRYANRRTQAMETIHSILKADAAEFCKELEQAYGSTTFSHRKATNRLSKK